MSGKNKKVTIVNHESCFGGSSKSLTYLIKYLLKLNYDITLVNPQNAENQKIFKSFNIRIIEYSQEFYLNLHFTNIYPVYTPKGFYVLLLTIFRFILGYFYAVNLFRRTKPDIVIANEYVLAQFNFAAKKLNIKSYSFVRSKILDGSFNFRKKIIIRFLQKYTDKLFCITRLEAAQFNSNAEIIPEFVDSDDSCREHNSETGYKKIIMVGGINQIKGSLVFLKAAEILLNMSLNVKFYLGGKIYNKSENEIKYYNECINIINRYPDDIIYIGEKENIVKEISESDVLIVSNVETHFARPILEAWINNVLVIASDTAHNKLLFENDDEIFIYPCRNEKTLATKIESLIKLPEEKVNDLKNKVSEKINTEFNISNTIEKLNRIFDGELI